LEYILKRLHEIRGKVWILIELTESTIDGIYTQSELRRAIMYTRDVIKRLFEEVLELWQDK